MRKILHFLAAAVILAGLLVLAGCQKENWDRKGAKEVKFGVSAHSSATTRTEYKEYTEGASTQGIKWLKTDEIRIYSPNSARRVAVENGPETTENPYYYWADYKIVPSTDNPSNGTLKNLSNDGAVSSPDPDSENDLYEVGNGLIWLDDNQATFYGVYPKPSSDAGSGNTATVPGTQGKFSFTIPSLQYYSEKGDMSYAFMTSKTTASKGQNVLMTFYPDFTAFEFFLKSTEEGVTLNDFYIRINDESNTTHLAGPFDVDVSGTKSYTFYDNSSSQKYIHVNMGAGKDIPSGDDEVDPLVFTVFALPRTLSNLRIEIEATYSSGAKKTWKLDLSKSNGTTINFTACSKHRLTGLLLPGGEWLITFADGGMTVEEWITNSDNNQTMVIE